jgi:hypothetical protein
MTVADFVVLLREFFLEQTPLDVVSQLNALFGWVILSGLLLYAGLNLHRVRLYKRLLKNKWKWVLLALDVPPMNVQTPKAVEQMFAQLVGAWEPPQIKETLWEGYRQRWFSFEIVGIEGYIQFLARTEEKFRDLLEASIYAQYPECEITEVEDYVTKVPQRWPDKHYKMWAADVAYIEDEAFPIRCYQEFEHNISKDTVLKDPVGTLLESFSRLGPGEQFWFQIILKPVGNSWKENCIKKVKELIGEKKAFKETRTQKTLNAFSDAPIKALGAAGDVIFGAGDVTFDKKDVRKDDGPPNQILYLTPGQKETIEMIERKIQKVGFRVKMRCMYIARKEVYKPSRAINLFFGALRQFDIPSSNGLKPYVATAGVPPRVWKYRANLLMKAYRKRESRIGKKPFHMNIEELASIWHFPMSHVRTPLVQHVQARQSEPPSTLPVEYFESPTYAYGQELPTEQPAPPTPASGTDAYGYSDDMRFG